MSPEPDYLPVVTRLPEALQEEAEAIAEAEAAQRKAEAEQAARTQEEADYEESLRAAKEAEGYAEDTERLHRESQ